MKSLNNILKESLINKSNIKNIKYNSTFYIIWANIGQLKDNDYNLLREYLWKLSCPDGDINFLIVPKDKIPKHLDPIKHSSYWKECDADIWEADDDINKIKDNIKPIFFKYSGYKDCIINMCEIYKSVL